LVLVLLFVPETRPEGGGAAAREAYAAGDESHLPEVERTEHGSMWRALRRRPVVLLFAPLAFFTHLIYAQHAFTLPLHLGALFGEAGAAMFGAVMSANAVAVLAFTTLVLHLFGSRRALSNMACAGLLFAAGFGMLALADSFPLFLLSVGIWTLGEILMATNAPVFVANHTPVNHRGRFNGFLTLMFGLGFTLAPLVSGRLVEPLGIERFWMAVGVFGAVTSALFLLLDMFDRYRNRA
jgi:MFS family permease